MTDCAGMTENALPSTYRSIRLKCYETTYCFGECAAANREAVVLSGPAPRGVRSADMLVQESNPNRIAKTRKGEKIRRLGGPPFLCVDSLDTTYPFLSRFRSFAFSRLLRVQRLPKRRRKGAPCGSGVRSITPSGIPPQPPKRPSCPLRLSSTLYFRGRREPRATQVGCEVPVTVSLRFVRSPWPLAVSFGGKLAAIVTSATTGQIKSVM